MMKPVNLILINQRQIKSAVFSILENVLIYIKDKLKTNKKKKPKGKEKIELKGAILNCSIKEFNNII